MTSLAQYDRAYTPRERPAPVRRLAAEAVADLQSEPVAAHHYDDVDAVLTVLVAWLRDPDGARLDAVHHRDLRNILETIGGVADALDAQLAARNPTLFGAAL